MSIRGLLLATLTSSLGVMAAPVPGTATEPASPTATVAPTVPAVVTVPGLAAQPTVPSAPSPTGMPAARGPAAAPGLPTAPSQLPAAGPPAVPGLPTAPGPAAAPGLPFESVPQDGTPEVLVEAQEPQYVAPTLRDRIGRIWAPVLINGKGPFRLVLDTGASHSAIIAHVAESLGLPAQQSVPILVRGVTGSALVPTIHAERMEVGELLIEPTTLPIVADVFGGAEGVLGREGLPDKRIFADFSHDHLVISRSHRDHAPPGFTVIPLKLVRGLLAAEVRIGGIKAQAIIDTGGQGTVGNLALRNALMKVSPKDTTSEEIMGVTLDLQRGDMVTAPPIAFGAIQIRQVRVTFADIDLFNHLQLNREPTLLLGMDVLGSFDVLIIDYRMRELQVRLRGSSTAAR